MKKLSKVALSVSVLGLSMAGFAVQSQTNEAQAIYFENCTQAWQAGYADIPQGADGYRLGLDRNRNGIACELKDSNGQFVPRVETPKSTDTVVEEPTVVEETPAQVETYNEEEETNAPIEKALPKTSAVK